MRALQVTYDRIDEGIEVKNISYDEKGNGLPAIVVDGEEDEEDQYMFVDENCVEEVVFIEDCEGDECSYGDCEGCEYKRILMVYAVGLRPVVGPEIKKYPSSYIISKESEEDEHCMLVFWEIAIEEGGDAKIFTDTNTLVLGKGSRSYVCPGCGRNHRAVQFLAALKDGEAIYAKIFNLNESDLFVYMYCEGTELHMESDREEGQFKYWPEYFLVNSCQ